MALAGVTLEISFVRFTASMATFNNESVVPTFLSFGICIHGRISRERREGYGTEAVRKDPNYVTGGNFVHLGMRMVPFGKENCDRFLVLPCCSHPLCSVPASRSGSTEGNPNPLAVFSGFDHALLSNFLHPSRCLRHIIGHAPHLPSTHFPPSISGILFRTSGESY